MTHGKLGRLTFKSNPFLGSLLETAWEIQIFSVLTSLGEECLAFGKKVIFLDNFYPVSNFCKDAFPKDFHFAIPKNQTSLLRLSRKCLSNDIETSIKYQTLKTKLNGEIDFNKKNIIPDTIEKFLI